VGVLVAGVENFFEERSIGTMEGAVGVSMEGGPGYHLFYFPDLKKGTGAHVVTGISGSIQSHTYYDKVTLATAESIKSLGIHDPFALIRYEVSCGSESYIDYAFVMTVMERLDGTPAYPLHMTEVMADLFLRNEKILKKRADEIEKALEVLREQFKAKGAEIRKETSIFPLAYWKDDGLEVTIQTLFREMEYGWGCPIQTPEPCSALSMVITVENNSSFRVDRNGKVLKMTAAPLQSYSQGSLPPP
jgi:hypothetical protein